MSTAIPRRKYPVSLAPGSQATSGPVSTWMGDRLGIPGAVDFFFHCKISLYIDGGNERGPRDEGRWHFGMKPSAAFLKLYSFC